MKLLLENWRKLLEGEIVDLPTKAVLDDRYASYIRHLDIALKELKRISKIFGTDGHTVESIEIMITELKLLRDDSNFKYDVETF